MKKIYTKPAMRVYTVQLHNQLCTVSGHVNSSSMYYEGEDNLDD